MCFAIVIFWNNNPSQAESLFSGGSELNGGGGGGGGAGGGGALELIPSELKSLTGMYENREYIQSTHF